MSQLNFVTTRHLVLEPIVVPNSVIPTLATIRQLNFVTIRHPVLNPIFIPSVPTVVTVFVPIFVTNRQLVLVPSCFFPMFILLSLVTN